MSYRFENETIHLDNLRVNCIIGINPQERVTEQPLLISLRIPAHFERAAHSEDIAHTINYSEVAREARAFAIQSRCELLETLVRKLGAHLCEKFGLRQLHLTIRKPQAISESDGPAVSLTIVSEGHRQEEHRQEEHQREGRQAPPGQHPWPEAAPREATPDAPQDKDEPR